MNSVGISVGKTSGKILTAIEQNNTITMPELAEHIGVTERSNVNGIYGENIAPRTVTECCATTDSKV
jgi:hypothetical protein